MIERVLFLAKVREGAGGQRAAGGLLLPCLLSLALVGCLAKRNTYDVPDIPLSPQFKNQLSDSVEKKPEVKLDQPEKAQKPPAAPDDGSMVEWWRYLGNRELEGLIHRGMANNPDVRIATIRLAQAKVRANQADAGLLPSVSMPLTVARQAPGGTVGSVPVGSSSRAPQTSIQTSLRSDFRLDVWGEQSALVESAQLQMRRAAFERDNVQRNVTATIASSYIELIALNDRLRVSKETERVLTDTLRTVERRLVLGDATVGELEQQKAMVFGLRAAIPSMEQQREDAINALAFLVGTLPGSLSISDEGLDSLNVPQVLPGLPSSLLLRRPDVRMMEARLLAADADIDVARTRILPPVDLTAQAGYSSNALAQLFMPKAFFWSTVASLTASIFDAGKRENEKKFNESIYEEMVETYVRTIYQAMREVESALATIRLAGRRLDSQREAAQASRRSWEINARVYAMGGVDHLTLLESERTFHRYQDDYQRAQMEHYKGYVSLFSALGGGVKPASALPGQGKRPNAQATGAVSLVATVDTAGKAFSVDGVDVLSGGFGSTQAEGFWLIELPSLYHRSVVGAAWRDLRKRYPEFMEGRMLRPRLSGRIDDSDDGQEAWYRLSIAQFVSESEAQAFCTQLIANQERCQVAYSRPGERPSAPLAAKSEGVQTVAVNARKAPEIPSPPADPEVSVPSEAPVASVSSVAILTPAYSIQLGAFLNSENAAVASAVWKFRGYDVYVAESRGNDGRIWYSVRTGEFTSRQKGLATAQAIRLKEESPALLVAAITNQAGQVAQVDIEPLLAERLKAEIPVLPEPPEVLMAKPLVPNAVLSSMKSSKKSKAARQSFTVQLAAFSVRENARLALDFWQARGLNAYLGMLLDAEGRPWYAVRSGEFASRREAAALAVQLGRKENASAMVVPYDSEARIASEAPTLPVTLLQSLAVRVEEQPEKTDEEAPLQVSDVLEKPTLKSGAPGFSVQLGSFASIENAASSFAEWRARGYEPYVCETDDIRGNLRFAVRTGEFARKAQAQQIIRAIQRQDGVRAVLVPALLDAQGELRRIDVTPLLLNPAVDLPPSAELSVTDVR